MIGGTNYGGRSYRRAVYGVHFYHFFGILGCGWFVAGGVRWTHYLDFLVEAGTVTLLYHVIVDILPLLPPTFRVDCTEPSSEAVDIVELDNNFPGQTLFTEGVPGPCRLQNNLLTILRILRRTKLRGVDTVQSSVDLPGPSSMPQGQTKGVAIMDVENPAEFKSSRQLERLRRLEGLSREFATSDDVTHILLKECHDS